MNPIVIRPHPKYHNVYISGSIENPKLFTKNLAPKSSVYGEKLIEYKGIEYREWDPHRSKLAALLLGTPSIDFLKENSNCLYLGASSGTTISHISDILNKSVIFGVEFAERSIRQLIQNITNRPNVVPILGDARFPNSYVNSVFSDIDLIYQDVAQPNQADIAIVNCDYYLNKNGILILAIKSQSIDSVQKSKIIYKQEKLTLENAGYEILETVNIHKYAANHIVLIVKK